MPVGAQAPQSGSSVLARDRVPVRAGGR